MGYYSDFEVTTTPALEGASVSEWDSETIDAGGWWSIADVKWYDWKEDLLRLSTEHPGSLIACRRSGEDNLDLEVAFFKGGKSYSELLPVTWPKFDKDNLE